MNYRKPGCKNIVEQHEIPVKYTEEECSNILAKSCHDLDILRWIIDKPCKSISAYGSLKWLTDPNPLTSTIDASIESNIMGFKAEESRLKKRIVEM